MNVVHVVAAGEVGGAERMLVDLLRDPPGNHSVALFTPSERVRRVFEPFDVDDRGVVREGPLPFLASAFGRTDVRWLAGVLERRRASVVHLHTFASQVLGTRAAERIGARIVRTEHSTRVYEDPSCWPFARWSLPRADAVVFISEHVRRVALARAPDLARTFVVPNGVDLERFVPRPPRRPDGRVRFVAVGRLDARKGLDLAIAALVHVPGAELVLVGDGEERRRLSALAARLGVQDRVRFEGFAADVREALADADVALSSAREEGLGIALLEAMAMERPVVGVPVGGVLELVVSGETGWLAATRTADALAGVMRSAAADPGECARRGRNARERVVRHFSVSAMRDGYRNVYARVTPRSPLESP